jgi:hypothetical protein
VVISTQDVKYKWVTGDNGGMILCWKQFSLYNLLQHWLDW